MTELALHSLADREVYRLVYNLFPLLHLNIFFGLFFFSFFGLHFAFFLFRFFCTCLCFFVFLFFLLPILFLINFHFNWNFLFNFMFLNKICRADSKNTIWINSHFHFHLLISPISSGSDITYLKEANVPTRERNVCHVFPSNLKGVTLEKGQHLGKWYSVKGRENLHLPRSLVLDTSMVVPNQLDRIRLDVHHAKLSHLE